MELKKYDAAKCLRDGGVLIGQVDDQPGQSQSELCFVLVYAAARICGNLLREPATLKVGFAAKCLELLR